MAIPGILVQWGFNDTGSDRSSRHSVVYWPANSVAVVDVIFHGQGCRGRKPAVCIYCGKTRHSCTAAYECCAERCAASAVMQGVEVMPAARPAIELLDGYGDVIDSCRTLAQVGDRYWNSIYMPLISSVADYFQLLTDRYREHKLIEIALDGAHKSLELCVAADIQITP